MPYILLKQIHNFAFLDVPVTFDKVFPVLSRQIVDARQFVWKGYMSFRPMQFQPMQFQPLSFQPITLSTACNFNRMQFQPLAISTACNFNLI